MTRLWSDFGLTKIKTTEKCIIASVGKGGKGSADWNYCPPSESVALLSFIMNLNSLSWKCIKVELTNLKKRWCAFVKTICFFGSVCKDGMHTRSRFISGLPTALCGWNEIGQISLMAAPQNFSAQKGTLPRNAHRWKKWPLYCPQGSGTLRQQLLMMHGIAGYCMVLHCIA